MVLKKSLFLPSVLLEERQERGNHEPLVSLRRPGSEEQAQFFTVFRSNGGERESESHAREGVKIEKKSHQKNTCTPMHIKIEKPRKTF